MEKLGLKQQKKKWSFLTKVVMILIILATVFSVYLTVKLIYSGFTFR